MRQMSIKSLLHFFLLVILNGIEVDELFHEELHDIQKHVTANH